MIRTMWRLWGVGWFTMQSHKFVNQLGLLQELLIIALMIDAHEGPEFVRVVQQLLHRGVLAIHIWRDEGLAMLELLRENTEPRASRFQELSKRVYELPLRETARRGPVAPKRVPNVSKHVVVEEKF